MKSLAMENKIGIDRRQLSHPVLLARMNAVLSGGVGHVLRVRASE